MKLGDFLKDTFKQYNYDVLQKGAQAQFDEIERMRRNPNKYNYVYPSKKAELFPTPAPEDAEIISETKWEDVNDR